MKDLKHIIGLLIVVFAFTSCAKEDILSSEEKGHVENTAYAIINFTRTSDMDVSISRNVTDGAKKDVTVTDLYVYIFDATSGSLLTNDPIHIDENKLNDGENGKQEILTNVNGKPYNSSWVRIPVAEEAFNKKVHIYLVANAIEYTGIIENITDLENIKNKKNLTDLVYQYQKKVQGNKLLQDRTNFLMTGHGAASHINPIEYNISKTGEINDNDGNKPNIVLERVEAKINFTINNGNNNNFIAKNFRVYKYPIKSYADWQYYLETGNSNLSKIIGLDAAKNDEDFSDIDAIDISNNKFTFYMPENLKSKEGANLSETIGAQVGLIRREKRDNAGTWTNAPELSTYVEVTGEFKGNSAKLKSEIKANMTYTVHLGFANNKGDSYYVNDYTTFRNHEYNYNITVNDVENIIAEITKEKDAKEITFAEGNITLKETITLRGTTPIPFKLYQKETISLDNSNDYSWFRLVRNQNNSIEEWAKETQSGAGGDYNFRISDNTEGAHEATFKAIRTSEDRRRKIIREITVTTGN